MNKKNITSDMSHKNKYSAMCKPNTASKNNKKMHIDAAKASTSNIKIASELERNYDETITQKNPDIKNNKCKSTNGLDTHNDNYIHKDTSLSTQDDFKKSVSIKANKYNKAKQKLNVEMENKKTKKEETETKVNIMNKKVPVSKLIMSQNAECETELMSVCLNSNANDTINIQKNNIDIKANLDNIPKRLSRRKQLISSINQHDKMEMSTETKNALVSGTSNEVIPTPAEPSKSLPSNLETSVKNNKKKSRSVKNNLSTSIELSTEKIQSMLDADDNSMKLRKEEELTLTIGQIPFQATHDDTSLSKSISEVTNKNTDLQNTFNPMQQEECKTSETDMKHNEQSQSPVPVVLNVKRKRGRPRKTINNSIDQTTPKTEISNVSSKNDDTLQEISDIIDLTVRSTRRSISKINVTTNIIDLSDDSDPIDIEDKPIVKKRGRPPSRGRGRGRGRGISRNSLDLEYIPKSMRKDGSQSETIKHNDLNLDETNTTAERVTNMRNTTTSNSSDINDSVQLVTCAKCNQQMPNKHWSSHNLNKHNNMAWQENEEPLDFENDIKLLKKVLARALKQKKNYLTCEKCEETKRSVNGFVSHMQFCGKSEDERQALMMTCPICKSVMMPSSMEIHERYHRQLALIKKDKNTEIREMKSIISAERNKRKAAEKAISKISEFVKEDLASDHKTKVPSGDDLDKYSDFEKDEDESSSESDIDVKYKYRLSKTQINSDGSRVYNKMAFLDKEVIQRPQSTRPYRPSLRWTLEFELKNYELALFEDDMPNAFTLLENNDAAKYLPELTNSMAMKHEKVDSSKNQENFNNNKWKHLSRFESDIYEAVPTFFVGGPVWALAWLPIPSPMYTKNPTQYVAISTHPTMESEYTVGNNYSGPNIIQIWDIGSLSHNVDSTNKSPALAYAIAHNNGTIWCLEWCPSGCYQDIDLGNYKLEENKLRRMGLLAAACSDGCVNIYSLPFADELKFDKTEYNSLPIYKTDPVVTLVVNHLLYESNKQDWQCMKLSWTKEHGHNIIAAGFTNGYIALWNLTTTCPMLLNVRKNTKLINAFQHFFAHHNAVSMIALVPYGGSRFLASGSIDRSYKFWDLEDTSAPRHCAKKGIILDGTWMTHWPCSVLSFDDALGYQYTHSSLISLRDYGFKYCPILPTNSPTYSVTVSDYANSIAHGTLAGEVITIFPHQLLYTEKLLPKKRQLNSTIKIVDLLGKCQNTVNKDKGNTKDKNSKDYCYMPETYNECKDRFGIIFQNNVINLKETVTRDKQHYTLYNNKLTSIPIEQYPFTSVNRVAWNPNAWSYLWLMVGYQNGVMRLLNSTFMSPPHEFNTLLESHVKCVLAKGNTSTR